jgi:hypothetical protein
MPKYAQWVQELKNSEDHPLDLKDTITYTRLKRSILCLEEFKIDSTVSNAVVNRFHREGIKFISTSRGAWRWEFVPEKDLENVPFED